MNLKKNLLYTLLLLFTSIHSYAQNDEIPVERGYRDYFSQVADFTMSFTRYQTRGYAATHEDYRINGIKFRTLDNNNPVWEALLGYTTSTRKYQFYKGLEFDAQSGFLGGVAGSEYISSKEIDGRTMQVSGSSGNRNFTFRLGAMYQNSWDNGLSLSIEASRRWGRSLSIEGVWSDAGSLIANLTKVFDARHSLDFNIIFTPNRRSNLQYSTDEAFELTQNKLYNPNWGWQNGKQRSNRSRTSIMPIATLVHTFLINENSKLTSTIGVRVGRSSFSAINWQNAPNPNPDYYKYLPSYQTTTEGKAELTRLWETDQNVSQINYGRIYKINSQDQAHYIEEERISQTGEFIGQTIFSTKLGRSKIIAGAELEYTNELRFKQVSDLMGANYWVDIDYFREFDDDNAPKTQNNMRNPNRHVGVGDEFGYKYRLERFIGGVWGVYEIRKNNWYYRVGSSLKLHTVSRDGYYEKENFSGNQSFGKSELYSSVEFRLKGLVEYRLGTKWSTHLAVTYCKLPPMIRNSFMDVNYRNNFVENLERESLVSAQIGVKYNSPVLRFSVSCYGTETNYSTEVHHLYDDIQGLYCDYVLSDISKLFYGGEFSFEAKLIDQLWLNLATSISSNMYTNNPTGTEYVQSTGVKLLTESVNYNDRHVPLSPQTFFNLGFSYNPVGWFASLNVTGFSNNYVTLSPIRYTARARDNTSDRKTLTNQEALPSGYMINISGGKTFEFKDYSRLGIFAGINNITDQRFKTAGYQTNRLSKNNKNLYSPMPDKYYHSIGANFYLTLTYTF